MKLLKLAARHTLRLKMMTTAQPLTTFAGYLKFHRPEALNALGQAAIQFAFPGFLQLVKPSPEMLEEMRHHREMGADYVAWEDRPHRRYAGDFTLPRGCYFSVCRNAEGDDGGTVANEMNAYREPEKTGPVAAFDLMSETSREALRIKGGPRHAFGIFIKDKNRFLQSNEPVLDQSVLQGSGALVVDVPYQVEYREIEGILDMRLPHVQEWFFNYFRLGDGQALDKPNGGNIDSFLQMLPTLTSVEPGGNDCDGAGRLDSFRGE